MWRFGALVLVCHLFQTQPLLKGINTIIRVLTCNSDSMIVRKPWITYNHAKISELNPGSPQVGNDFASRLCF